MAGFYERRKSIAAMWCFRLAIIAVPFFILTIFLHRNSSITTVQAFWLIAFGIGMVLASLVFGIRAAADLWEKGYKGGRATVNGIVLSILLLIPFGFQLVNAIEKPQVNDVSTDVINTPLFIKPIEGLASAESESTVYDDYASRQIVSSYPELVARRYNAPPERVVTSLVEILKQWGWSVQAGINIPVAEPEPASEPAVNNDDLPDGENIDSPKETDNDELAGDPDELAAILQTTGEDGVQDIIVQAQAKSFFMKLPSYIVVRLTSENEGTLVDVRSASVWGRHDFGSNAKNISQLLEALDAALAGLAGEV
ncbi:MAG: DUF1499 domain-containing protein [Salaquimonas sp.]